MIVDPKDPRQTCYAQAKLDLDAGHLPLAYPKGEDLIQYGAWNPGLNDLACLTSDDPDERMAYIVVLMDECRARNHDEHYLPVL